MNKKTNTWKLKKLSTVFLTASLAIFYTQFIPQAQASGIKGTSLGEYSSSCDYYLIEDTSGDYTFVEWYGGITPDAGDTVIGDLHSFGFKDLYNVTNDQTTRVWLDDYLLSKDDAAEKLIDECGYESDVEDYFSNYPTIYNPITPPTNPTSPTTCPDTINGFMDTNGKCWCNSDYHWDTTTSLCAKDISSSPTTPSSPTYPIDPNLCTNGHAPFQQSACIQLNQYCITKIGSSFWSSATASCQCNSGYTLNASTNQCAFTESNTGIITSPPSSNTNTPPDSNPIQLPINGTYNPLKNDPALINRLRGQILLQTQEHGEAWYINPVDSIRYYMPNGAAAYTMMRSFGLGIINNDLNKIPTVSSPQEMLAASNVCASNTLANKLKGKILLQVQERGEAWYIDPRKCRKIYMKDGEAAYQIMRYLGLGITNTNLEKIPSNTASY